MTRRPHLPPLTPTYTPTLQNPAKPTPTPTCYRGVGVGVGKWGRAEQYPHLTPTFTVTE